MVAFSVGLISAHIFQFDEHGVVKVVDFGYAEKIAPGEVIRSGQLKGSPVRLIRGTNALIYATSFGWHPR